MASSWDRAAPAALTRPSTGRDCSRPPISRIPSAILVWAQLGLRGPRGLPTDRPAQMINIFRCKAWLREKLPSARASGALEPATECANDWIGLYNLTAC